MLGGSSRGVVMQMLGGLIRVEVLSDGLNWAEVDASFEVLSPRSAGSGRSGNDDVVFFSSWIRECESSVSSQD